MQFKITTAAFLALIGRVLAQTNGFDAITKPTTGEVLTAGSTFQVTWDYDDQYAGTISIALLEGTTATTLELGDTIATGIDNSAGSYSWAIDSNLGEAATYGLKISLESDPSTFQYSFPFKITAVSGGSSSSVIVPVSTPSAPSASSTVSAVSASTSSPVSVPATTSEESSSSSSSSSSISESASTLDAGDVGISSTVAVATATTSATTIEKPTTTAVATSAATTGAAAKTTLATVVSSSSSSSSSSPTTGSGKTATTTASSSIVTAGAGKVVAGTFAAVGGLAAALLAM